MIEANILKSGNLVYYRESLGSTITSYETNGAEIWSVRIGQNILPLYNYDLDPVPISHGTLLNLGYFHEVDPKKVIKNSFSVKPTPLIDQFEMYVNHEHVCNVTYIHEIQNCYYSIIGQQLSIIDINHIRRTLCEN